MGTAKHRAGTFHDENQYLNLLETVIREGTPVEGRNGPTRSIQGAAMHFSLAEGCLPLLTTKRVAWRTCLRELLWFISGSTDAKVLEAAGVRIWSANGTKEFLAKAGIEGRREGDLGPVYGHQWRHYNADYSSCDSDYAGQGVDQLARVIGQLKDPSSRGSRRIIMNSWNPCQLSEMALPPCHVLVQFHVSPDGLLSCSLYQRSADMGLGVPFNVASYAMFTHLLAAHCGLTAHELIHHIGDCHAYANHLPQLRGQLARVAKKAPTLTILRSRPGIGDYTETDFSVDGYDPMPAIRMPMSA